ncbi:hypothetical protein LOCC1_G001390 [Lachnellula occidentalis]|uniref:RNA polymerase II assembly factor n=1 Tax=Lachnellula occidentalis TaxID=215460 RepID=A0A8H8S609_9HELO|nr:hypothetical protein LOCC1_G001390 [Lachnellula occidentalis]
MEAPGDTKRPPLMDRILQFGKAAYDPDLSEETRRQNQAQFKTLLNGTKSLALLPVLTVLVQPGRTQPWLRAPLISALALLPLRPHGVQNTIEFILSVHPSARLDAPSGSDKRSGISHEALNAASRLLSSPPGGMAPDDWFSGIGPQLFSLLQGKGEPEMDKAAAFIIGFGILGRKQYGAPGMRLVSFLWLPLIGAYTGMAGWRAFVEPILRCIDPNNVPRSSREASPEEPIITLGAPNILVTSEELAKGIRNLSTLLTSHPHPSLAKRLLGPILLPLWAIASWHQGDETTTSQFCKPARRLLSTLVQLSPSFKDSTSETGKLSSSSILCTILQNLTFKGRSDPDKECWEFAVANDGGIQIQESTSSVQDSLPVLGEIDRAADRFISLMEMLAATPEFDVEISSLFMSLCSKWFSQNSKLKQVPEIFTRIEPISQDQNIGTKLIEAKVMQKMMTAFPDKLVSDSHQVLELVHQVLADAVPGNEDGNTDDTVSVALSLLNIVLMSPSFKGTAETKTLDAIQTSLQTISRRGSQETSTTAQNMLLLLKFRASFDEPENPTVSKPTDQQLEDRKTYNLAISYLTTIDSPPPVRAQGLELISNLIRANSSILDIQALLVLFSSLLQDSEEYIYLRVIQSFIQLSQRHPKAVMKDLIDRYVDPNEDSDLDQRLRLGEALLQVAQDSPAAFSGEAAKSVCEGLIFVASRRGYRPKTEQEQHKRNKLKRKKNQEAEEVWDGPVPQLDEILEPESHETNEILSQITSGWEGKRGSEDVRVRASAISILGSAIEANIAGIGSRLLSTVVDLSIHILTLEPEPEKGIIRRAAILLVMHFVRALDTARAEGKKLGFGFVGQSLEDVQRILGYVEETDNDGLVKQHARDVIEGLQAWQMNALLPERDAPSELGELAGLSINPGRGNETVGGMRPRIEEIE